MNSFRSLLPVPCLLGLLVTAPARPASADRNVACDVAALQTAITQSNSDGVTLQLTPACFYNFSFPDLTTYENAAVPVLTGKFTIEGNGATLRRALAPSAFR